MPRQPDVTFTSFGQKRDRLYLDQISHTKIAMKKFKYTIDLNKNIIDIEFSGFISAETLIDNISKVREDPDFHKGLNSICDFRNASLAKGFMETSMVTNFVNETSHERGDFKLAIIVSRSDVESAEIFRLFSMPGLVKLCSSKSEAEAWVTPDHKKLT